MSRELEKYPGFYPVPFANQYAVSKDGVVINVARNKIMKPHLGAKGYVILNLIDNNGSKRSIAQHRLMALVFIPNDDPKKDQVNHINGIKHDNRLENLEWCSCSENRKHALDNNLAFIGRAENIIVRVHGTGELIKFRTIRDYETRFGLSHGGCRGRINSGPEKLWPNPWHQVKLDDGSEWVESEDLATRTDSFKGKTAIYLRCLLDPDLTIVFETLQDVAEYLGIAVSTASQYISFLKEGKVSIVPGFYQLKQKYDEYQWMDIDDPISQLMIDYPITLPVLIKHRKTGKQILFMGVKDCGRFLDVKHTTMFYRLNNNKDIHPEYSCRYYDKIKDKHLFKSLCPAMDIEKQLSNCGKVFYIKSTNTSQ